MVTHRVFQNAERPASSSCALTNTLAKLGSAAMREPFQSVIKRGGRDFLLVKSEESRMNRIPPRAV